MNNIPASTTLYYTSTAFVVLAATISVDDSAGIAVSPTTAPVRRRSECPCNNFLLPWRRLTCSIVTILYRAEIWPCATQAVVVATISPLPCAFLFARAGTALSIKRVVVSRCYTETLVTGIGGAIFTADSSAQSFHSNSYLHMENCHISMSQRYSTASQYQYKTHCCALGHRIRRSKQDNQRLDMISVCENGRGTIAYILLHSTLF